MTSVRSRRIGLIVSVACLLGAALSGCGRAGAEPGDAPMASGRWTVEARDRFSSGSLDRDRWTTCYWWDDQGCTNLGNNEAEWYVPSAVTVRDGHLRLQATEDGSKHRSRTFSYASGMVTSGRSSDSLDDPARYAFTFGYVEVRFRTPEGAGLWPAIWMLPVTNESLPEIDLLEQYGDDTSTSSMTFHPDGPDAERSAT